MNGLPVRVQEVGVIHSNRMCRHLELMGPSAAFTCGPVKILASVAEDNRIIPAGDTAGDLREHANLYRQSKRAEAIVAEKQDKSTIVEDWRRFQDMRRQFIKQNQRTVRNLTLQKDGLTSGI